MYSDGSAPSDVLTAQDTLITLDDVNDLCIAGGDDEPTFFITGDLDDIERLLSDALRLVRNAIKEG